MKVFLETPTESRGIHRAYDALIKHAPKQVQVVDRPEDADLEILHIIGRNEQNRDRIKKLTKEGRSYAMIQYCLKSTMNPHVDDWIDLWKGAKLVWSYYDLYNIADREGHGNDFPFYFAPLGVDTSVFKDRKSLNRDFVIATNSSDVLEQSVREAIIASQRLKMNVFHLGPNVQRKGVTCMDDISDYGLSHFYSRCEFVSGLRRTEGFELPVIEGLMCGARPIVFDKPHYRHWYNDFAIFIPELGRPEVIDYLEHTFKVGTRPVTDAEKALAKKLFDWEKIITNFWYKLL